MKKIHYFVLSTIFIFGVNYLNSQNYYGPPKPGYPLVYGTLTQGFNQIWNINSKKLHTGLDIAAIKGTSVYATKNGIVAKIGDLGTNPENGENWGQYVVIQLSNGEATGYLHIYHQLRIGQIIQQGEIIGTIYNNHLHYNECYQVADCQHGAFPNATYPNFSFEEIYNYYKEPDLLY